MPVRVTIDSAEPLDDVIRVLGAMYGVTLVVSDSEPETVPFPTADLDTAVPSPAVEADIATPSPTAAVDTATPSAAGVPEAATPPRKRPSRARGRAFRARKAVQEPASNAQIRSWARDNGYTVSDRGRVPAAIVSAYQDAQT
jgi:hypothetical protein